MGYVQGGRVEKGGAMLRGEGREGGAMFRGEAGCCSHWVGGVAMENGVHARTGGCPEGCICKESYVCIGGGGGVGGGGGWPKTGVCVNTEGG